LIAYKLFRVTKDKQLAPLFINRKLRVPIGVWMDAEFHPTKSFKPRRGWHMTLTPSAPHLKEMLKSGEVRVWCEVEIEDFEYHERPASQGGLWVLAQKMKVVRRL
jgi:hypothetical protein